MADEAGEGLAVGLEERAEVCDERDELGDVARASGDDELDEEQEQGGLVEAGRDEVGRVGRVGEAGEERGAGREGGGDGEAGESADGQGRRDGVDHVLRRDR